MKGFIKKLLREGLLKEDVITSDQLNSLEKELDNVFKTIGVDINFTKHFFERVNDERNGREITIDELRTIFKDVYSEYKNRFKKFGPGFTGVFKNPPTSINIPFVLAWDEKNQELDLVTKTIMRSKQFRFGSAPVLPVGSKNQPKSEPREKFKKIKLVDGTVIRYYETLNKFEDIGGNPINIDDIFDNLPEELQDKVMELMESIELPIEIGDTVLMGKFKNKKVVVKDIEWDEEKGDLSINGKPALKVRIQKKLKENKSLTKDSNYSAKDLKKYEDLHKKHKDYKNNYLNITYDNKDPLLDELKKLDFPNGLFSYLIDDRRPDLVDYFPYDIKLYSTESKEFPSPEGGWTSKDGFLGLNDGSELRLFVPVQDKVEILPTLWMLLHEFRHKMQHENDNIGGITSDDNPNKEKMFDFIGKETGADRNMMNHVFHEVDPMEVDANVFACELLDIPYNGSGKFNITDKTLKKLKDK